MMKARISRDEVELLKGHEETRELVDRLLGADGARDLCLTGSSEQFDELRDACSDVLLRIGFDDNYVATRTGCMLESLIDRLYQG